MAKIELIYSRQSSDYLPGKAYANPRFYTTPRTDVGKVFLVGEWPKIRADYEAMGVPVEPLPTEVARSERVDTLTPSPELVEVIKRRGRPPKDRPGDLPSTQGTSEAEVDAQNEAGGE